MELLSQYGSLLIIITAVFGFFMAFGVGANDVSNAMGTSVGSGTITPKQAIIIAMIFEAAGAYLAGGEVTETIKSGIIDTTQFIDRPEVLVFGMMAALFASGAWLLIASKMGWPVSTTHSIIGAIVGFFLCNSRFPLRRLGQYQKYCRKLVYHTGHCRFLSLRDFLSALKN